MYTCLHCLDYVLLPIYSLTGLKTAVILKDAKLSSLRRTLGIQSWFPADVLPVPGSNQSQSSVVRFYSFPLHHNCKYQKVLIVKRWLTPPEFLYRMMGGML